MWLARSEAEQSLNITLIYLLHEPISDVSLSVRPVPPAGPNPFTPMVGPTLPVRARNTLWGLSSSCAHGICDIGICYHHQTDFSRRIVVLSSLSLTAGLLYTDGLPSIFTLLPMSHARGIWKVVHTALL